mgnify:FL=1
MKTESLILDPAVAAYFDAVPEKRRPLVDVLHDLITSLYPSAEISLSWGMPTYRRGDGWVSLANQKRYVSLYTCDAGHLAAFKARHPEIRTGKACINFKSMDEIPADTADVIRAAMTR